MARFDIGGPGEVGLVGDGGETLGPFKADSKGVVEVPDDFQEALRELANAKGVKRLKDAPKETKKPKE